MYYNICKEVIEYQRTGGKNNKVVYNLYLVLINEQIQIYDRVKERVVYEGSSNYIPRRLLSAIVHDITIVHR